MDDLKKHIDEKLWHFIKRSYLAENYSEAIKDSIQFIGDLIREKSGLQTDGQNLIGQAFGGKNPKVKLNKLQTETEKNIQQGTESILRGIYSAIRNPRSHSKYEDKQEDADAIILFINLLLKQLDNSKGKFSKEIFLKRIKDKDFVANKKYVSLLIKTIPPKKYYDTIFDLLDSNEYIKLQNLKLVFHDLISKIKEEELEELLKSASEELRHEESNKIVVKIVVLFKDYWTRIDEDSIIRTENKLINCLKNGQYIDYKINEEGICATYINEIIDLFTLKTELADALFLKLKKGTYEEHSYLFKYFSKHIEELDKHSKYDLVEILIEKLSKGNQLFYEYANEFIKDGEIKNKIIKSVTNFVEEDNLPF